ncbi:hypothetical protein CCR75_005567 [Bremia lactucae]|uniref:Embryonic stem cell-specific 5-hydroxymethylcytosine-binding protein n=1 Tax=Bremia lactucae TaxID=4779 RepID=A0A976FKJ7_BRELC|nr:hypothetical protein CCR75_005567 [Bremia lactucae]
MCGRTRCTLAREEIAKAAGVAPEDFVNSEKYKPVENMGPGRYGPILLQKHREHSDGVKTNTQLQAMQWGLVPSFTKANAKPDHFLMFNARISKRDHADMLLPRAESLHERPAFKRLLKSKRCVVLIEGYYEWHQVDKREKQPYYFYKEQKLIKLAGLYDEWKNEAGELLCTYTILTTAVAPELKWLHNRMPVIFAEESSIRWLSDEPFEDLTDLLVPDSTDLKWYPVSKKVGSMQFQSESCATKIDIKHAGDIKSFFENKQEKQEPIDSSDTLTTKRKTKESTFANTASNLSPKEEDTKSDTSINKQVKHQHIEYIPASSLLNKCLSDKEHDLPPSKEPNKRRRVSFPAKAKLTGKLTDSKQSSLDNFFGPA